MMAETKTPAGDAIATVISVRRLIDENFLQLRRVVLDIDVERYRDTLAFGDMTQVHKEFLECVKEALTRPLTEEEARGDNPMSVEEFGLPGSVDQC